MAQPSRREYKHAVVALRDRGEWVILAVGDDRARCEAHASASADPCVVMDWDTLVQHRYDEQRAWATMARPDIVDLDLGNPRRDLDEQELWEAVMGSLELGFDGCPIVVDWEGELRLTDGAKTPAGRVALIDVRQPRGGVAHYRLYMRSVAPGDARSQAG